MIAELNLFLSTVVSQSERPATTAEEESGDQSFNSLLEDSLVTEQAPPPDTGESAPPDAANEASSDAMALVGALSAPPDMVSMEEITNSLGLTEKQIDRLAELIGISTDEMSRMEITAKNPGRNFPALMPNGAQKNLAELMSLVENGQLLDRQEAVSKIADMLGLTKSASATLLEKLGIFSFEVSGETAQTAQGESVATAQGKTEKNLQPSGQSSNQSANNSNNASGETPDIGANETDGDFGKNTDSNFKTALNQTSQIAHEKVAASMGAIAEAGDLKAQVASLKTFQPFTQPAGMEEANADKQAKTVMERIVEKASIISFPNRTRARISLSPPSLGFVNIEISMRKEGASARIVVESNAVKQILEQNIHQLKATFEQQGIKVEAMNVSVSEQGGNSSGGDARYRETRSAFSDYTAEGGATNEENPEDDALTNRSMRKKTHNHVLDIKV